MMMISPQFPSSMVRQPPTNSSITEMEYTRLEHVQLIAAAERHLVSSGKPCPDHQVCRRLAFIRWLFMTGRLTEVFRP
jgi:hypothetical protein